MRVVSIFFQRESADRPARRAARKPSSVSPSGVLMLIPVMAMRSAFDKVDLHDREGGGDAALQELPGGDGAEAVALQERGEDGEIVPGEHRGEEDRRVYPERADGGWDGAGRDLVAPGGG